ncbi:MAG: hypothetical protein WA361_04590 [Candidatus Acidiferrales bacterium]
MRPSVITASSISERRNWIVAYSDRQYQSLHEGMYSAFSFAMSLSDQMMQ